MSPIAAINVCAEIEDCSQHRHSAQTPLTGHLKIAIILLLFDH